MAISHPQEDCWGRHRTHWLSFRILLKREFWVLCATTLQDGGVEGCALSCENTKSRLAAEQPYTWESGNPPTGAPHRQSKEKSQEDGRMVTIAFKIKPHTHQRCLEGTNKALCVPGPWERSSDLHILSLGLEWKLTFSSPGPWATPKWNEKLYMICKHFYVDGKRLMSL